MPSLSNVAPTYEVFVHTTATDFLEATEHVLLEQERRSNLILAHALGRIQWEASHIALAANVATMRLTPYERSRAWWARRRSGNQQSATVGRDFWITAWTTQVAIAPAASQPSPFDSRSPRPPQLNFAVSVLGADPVFVFTPHHPMDLSQRFLSLRIEQLVQALKQYMPVERMSRVFALFPVAESIASTWTTQTGVARAPESQCNVFSTYCTVATFAGIQPLPDGHLVGLAGTRHTAQLARMYYDYERELVLHPVSQDFARSKVEQMITQEQIWIYEYPVLDASRTRIEYYEIAAMAALSRQTPAVAALSVVYTLPRLRGHRFAERLVGRVCNHVFAMNKSAVLFVPGGNIAAGSLLGRIGFYGMGMRASALGEEAETWREIGFTGAMRVSGSW